MKEISIFSSPFHRAIAYLVTFIVGTVLLEFFRSVVSPPRSLTPGLIFIAMFFFLGIFVVNKQNMLSRVSSASTLLVLSIIAMTFDIRPVADAHLLFSAAIVSYIGALPFLHHKHPIAPTILLSVFILATAAFISIAIPRLAV